MGRSESRGQGEGLGVTRWEVRVELLSVLPGEVGAKVNSK